MAFNFGNPSSSGTNTSGLFGTAGANNNTSSNSAGGGLFGSNASGGSSSTGFSFGTNANTGGNNKPSNIFGSSSTGGGLFGSKPAESNTNDTAKPVFSGFGGTSQTPATPGTNTSQSLFGSVTPATSGPPKFSFGNSSTTPAGQPPSQSLFGASTGQSNIFGNNAPVTTSAGPSEQKPNFSFGAPSSSSAPFNNTTSTTTSSTSAPFNNTTSTTTSSTSAPSLFGGAQLSTGGLFGAKPAESSNPSSGTNTPFGSKPPDDSQKPSSGGLFGAKPAESSAPSGLFGQKPSGTPQAPTSGGLFGQQQPSSQSASSGLFGQQQSSSQPASSGLFSAAPKPPAGTNQAQDDSNLNKQGTVSSNDPNSDSNPASKEAPNAWKGFEGSMKPPAMPSGPLFGAPPSARPGTSATSTTSGPTSSGLFAPASTIQPSSSTPASRPAFSFPSTSTTSASTMSGATTAPSAPSSTLFGTAPATSNAPSTSAPTLNLFGSATSAATTPATSATTSNLFGGAPTSTAAQPAATTTASTALGTISTTLGPVGGFGGLGTSTLGASTSGPIPPTSSRLKNKTMDEILTRWATDLTRYTKDFKSHAETIAHWDQIIVENSSKIDKLYIETRTCEKQTMSVEMQLTAVEHQQNELESWLSKYENEVDQMLEKEGTTQVEIGGPDQERERTYKLAEKLGERLEDMGRDLESMVEEINAANASLSKNTKADEPITQIVKILNSHLSQLQAIDQGTTALQAKVAAAQKVVNGMNYLNGTPDGNNAAVADFYRSFHGRR